MKEIVVVKFSASTRSDGKSKDFIQQFLYHWFISSDTRVRDSPLSPSLHLIFFRFIDSLIVDDRVTFVVMSREDLVLSAYL